MYLIYLFIICSYYVLYYVKINPILYFCRTIVLIFFLITFFLATGLIQLYWIKHIPELGSFFKLI